MQTNIINVLQSIINGVADNLINIEINDTKIEEFVNRVMAKDLKTIY